jgi:hypothetical protein
VAFGVGELQGVIRVKIGQKTEVAAVNADDVDIVTCQRSRCAEHIAVAAHHYRQIRLLTNFRQRARFDVAKLELMGNLLFDQNFV